MWPFRKYRIEIEKDGASQFCYYIWSKGKIIASGYKIPTATQAAEQAVEIRDDLLNADKISKGNVRPSC